KASPLLRAWLRRLAGLGVRVHTRHDWAGWTTGGALIFRTPEGLAELAPRRAALLALGGASWPKLGADGGWVPILRERGVEIAPLAPANGGLTISWSDIFRGRFAGQPVKRVRLSVQGMSAAGEMIVTQSGLECGAIYTLAAAIRGALDSGA